MSQVYEPISGQSKQNKKKYYHDPHEHSITATNLLTGEVTTATNGSAAPKPWNTQENVEAGAAKLQPRLGLTPNGNLQAQQAKAANPTPWLGNGVTYDPTMQYFQQRLKEKPILDAQAELKRLEGEFGQRGNELDRKSVV